MLTRNQTAQLKRIDKELDRRGLMIRVYHTAFPNKGHIVSVVYNHIEMFDIIPLVGIMIRDCIHFEIKMSAAYIIEMLERIGIYGVAICGPRDKPYTEFGAFVAKARYLKHIEKAEYHER